AVVQARIALGLDLHLHPHQSVVVLLEPGQLLLGVRTEPVRHLAVPGIDHDVHVNLLQSATSSVSRPDRGWSCRGRAPRSVDRGPGVTPYTDVRRPAKETVGRPAAGWPRPPRAPAPVRPRPRAPAVPPGASRPWSPRRRIRRRAPGRAPIAGRGDVTARASRPRRSPADPPRRARPGRGPRVVPPATRPGGRRSRCGAGIAPRARPTCRWHRRRGPGRSRPARAPAPAAPAPGPPRSRPADW